jgi:transcription termination/antitermination protein NusG
VENFMTAHSLTAALRAASEQPFPGSPMGSEPWFVLYVKPRHEKNVCRILRGKGYEEFLPLYGHRTSSRVTDLPLFPGYVFCRFDAANRLPVMRVPGVFSIVSIAGNPAPVEPTEIAALQLVISSGLDRAPWPALASGTPVTVTRGPLEGISGVVIRSKTSTRMLVSVALLHRSVSVEVERNWLSDNLPEVASGYWADIARLG